MTATAERLEAQDLEQLGQTRGRRVVRGLLRRRDHLRLLPTIPAQVPEPVVEAPAPQYDRPYEHLTPDQDLEGRKFNTAFHRLQLENWRHSAPTATSWRPLGSLKYAIELNRRHRNHAEALAAQRAVEQGTPTVTPDTLQPPRISPLRAELAAGVVHLLRPIVSHINEALRPLSTASPRVDIPERSPEALAELHSRTKDQLLAQYPELEIYYQPQPDTGPLQSAAGI